MRPVRAGVRRPGCGADGIELTPDDLAAINAAAAAITVAGDRYPEHMQRMIDR